MFLQLFFQSTVYLFGCSAFRLGFFSELLTFVTMWLLEEIALQSV